MSFPLAPWHMWGNSQLITIAAGIFGNPAGTQSSQLCRIAYARPESFNFLFGFRFIEFSAPTNDFTVDIFYDLTVGIGRSVIQIPAFETFRLSSVGGVAAQPQLFWSTQVNSPTRVRSVTNPAINSLPGVTSYIVCEDLQCQVRTVASGVPQTIQAEAFAFFSPRVHLRPEWFSEEGEQFRGKETGGT